MNLKSGIAANPGDHALARSLRDRPRGDTSRHMTATSAASTRAAPASTLSRPGVAEAEQAQRVSGRRDAPSVRISSISSAVSPNPLGGPSATIVPVSRSTSW
jgi:hypothetical protein